MVRFTSISTRTPVLCSKSHKPHKKTLYNRYTLPTTRFHPKSLQFANCNHPVNKTYERVEMMMAEAKKSKNEGRKRFTDKQISFLEYMFETESRPELRMKHQLANKLGLHPRQVAIWFQNKRARSKSRQIEQEYNTLKHDYETLASKSECLKKENQALLNQLEVLRNVAEKNGNSNSTSASEESDDRVSNERRENHENEEIRVPFLYLGEESKYAEIEEWEEGSLAMDLQKWLEF